MIQKTLTIEEICNKLRPIFEEKIDEIYFQYTIADDREEREEIAHLLNTLYQKYLSQLLDKGVLLEPPRRELINGTYNLATISYAKKKLFDFTLREEDWPRHICVTGMSGSGKTTFAFKIIEALNKHNKPYLVFDWKKSFRPLSAENNSIITFTVGNEKVTNLFKTNINQPPKGVAPKEWINVLSDLLTESFSASFGVHKIILETLDQAFKEWGIYSGSDNYPTWNHIKWRLEEKLGKTRGREAGWLESALRIATVITFGEFGKTMNYKGNNSFKVEELLNKKVIMELSSLGGVEKTFFCEFILTYIYKLKKAIPNETNHSFNYAIIVDEAHNIFLKKPTSFSNESTTDIVYREMREYGTSLICLDQHISKISDTVKGNSACHIAFQQQLPQDIYDISEIMSLRENRHYFSQLPVGSAIVKLAERYTLPFLIEVPYVEMRDKTITDEYIKTRMQAMMLNKNYENKTDSEFNEAIENPNIASVLVLETQNSDESLDFRSQNSELGAGECGGNQLPTINYQLPTTNHRRGSWGGSKSEAVSNLRSEFWSKEQNNLRTRKENSFLPDNLTEVQQTIYDFVTAHLNAGIELREIEKILEKSKAQGGYTTSDIMSVINLVFENQLTTPKKLKTVRYNNLKSDEQVFMEFLQKNPEHNLSTTEVYQQIGLSARKGTDTKKNLELKGLIRIEEIRYNKGWKKLIRLSN